MFQSLCCAILSTQADDFLKIFGRERGGKIFIPFQGYHKTHVFIRYKELMLCPFHNTSFYSKGIARVSKELCTKLIMVVAFFY